ncbi:glycosyltransferase family 2 protein [Paenibacillus athensensis]|uniref:Glycosyl transferase family 2 n=1 Tax=Paenibacillus athensensis TaxID=1967502 RepID=A0A4Y8Q5D4_9BACL|nr:glycosyltransferase family 2 protein [Paenibacillus athensensis]MCD1259511.1 glycosyltransferase family 2 protein [Paenibacillus athensensis]
MDISILIVSFNTRKLTLECLQSVYASQTEYEFEVTVIDNDSSDDSVSQIRKHFPQVRVIANRQNVGFAKANNQGIALANGRYVLLLNSDTTVEADTLQKMTDFMEEHPHAGAGGCRVDLPDGSLDKACKRGFPTPSASFYYAFGIARLFPRVPRFNQYQLGYLDPQQTHKIDCLVGAFMLVRKAVIDQIGPLDEQFFMYGEDIDWCYRIKQAGWDVYYYPGTRIIHHKGASSRRKPLKIVYEFHRAMAIFHNKHYSSRYPFWINGLVYTGVAVKLTAAVIKNVIIKRQTV